MKMNLSLRKEHLRRVAQLRVGSQLVKVSRTYYVIHKSSLWYFSIVVHLEESAPHRSEATNLDGFLIDIDVQDMPETPKVTLNDHSHDTDHFFSLSYQLKDKKYCNCRLCLCVDICRDLSFTNAQTSKWSPGHPISLVADVTTLRQHITRFVSLVLCIIWTVYTNEWHHDLLGSISSMGQIQQLCLDVAKRCQEMPEWCHQWEPVMPWLASQRKAAEGEGNTISWWPVPWCCHWVAHVYQSDE